LVHVSHTYTAARQILPRRHPERSEGSHPAQGHSFHRVVLKQLRL
jgi:hypothetical protein